MGNFSECGHPSENPMNFFYKESGETIEQGALLSVLAVLLAKQALRANDLLGM